MGCYARYSHSRRTRQNNNIMHKTYTSIHAIGEDLIEFCGGGAYIFLNIAYIIL